MKMKKGRIKTACVTPMEGESCCGVKAVITVDERGQIVLPKEVRDEAGLKAGDKLAVISLAQKGKFCCLTLMKVDELSNMVMVKLGPLLSEMKGGNKHEEK